MASSSSITLLQTMEWAKRFNFGRRSAIGNFLEPALTSANTVMQTILGAPFAWRWNRVVTGFDASSFLQDYVLVNWEASTAVQQGWMTVDDGGNCQVVNTAGTTGSVSPVWNTLQNQSTSDGSVVWLNQAPLHTPVSQTYSLGWIETASLRDGQAVPPKWYEIQSKLCLGIDSTQARPRFIAAQKDDGLGRITFRLMPVPEQEYSIAITLQQKPSLFTSVNQTWAPIPDEYSHIYNWGFLSMMWLFADDPRFAIANQKFVSQLLAAQQGLTQTQINIFLSNWQAITGQPIANSDSLAQGVQSRGV